MPKAWLFNYTAEDLENAITDVQQQRMSVKEAAAFYNIPLSTLYVKLTAKGYNVNENREERLVWSWEMTMRLIEAYRKVLPRLRTREIYHKKQMFKIIAQLMGDVSAYHCENRWRSLKKAYKKRNNSNKQTGSNRNHFEEFSQYLDPIFADEMCDDANQTTSSKVCAVPSTSKKSTPLVSDVTLISASPNKILEETTASPQRYDTCATTLLTSASPNHIRDETTASPQRYDTVATSLLISASPTQIKEETTASPQRHDTCATSSDISSDEYEILPKKINKGGLVSLLEEIRSDTKKYHEDIVTIQTARLEIEKQELQELKNKNELLREQNRILMELCKNNKSCSCVVINS